MGEVLVLRRYDRVIRGIALSAILDGERDVTKDTTLVLRDDGREVALAALEALLHEFNEQRGSRWQTPRSRPASDSWLAPRLHYSLRLTRAQAADKGLWHWLAIALGSEYIEWRWGASGVVNDDRWYGPIHKQGLARLWWGAEIFRNGPDYEPAERAFIWQDLINSFLHRPLIRSRSFAVGIVDALTENDPDQIGSSQVNALARKLNLCTAGRPPEAEVRFKADDLSAFRAWAEADAPLPSDWNVLPSGPPADDTTPVSLAGGRLLAEHGMALAGIALDK